jgi:TolB-like protein/Tfp pilus assembly protein PilF
MLAPGTQLGPYEIQAALGKGGMGEVYRAKDARLERAVAIKVLPQPFAEDRARLARFEREAKVVAAMSHPNILAIHDYGIEQGHTFAVMELLDGETLRARIAPGSLSWRRAGEIAVAIADGLAAAHAKGIVHRDLKPENIFLTDDGRVKILDFGLARIKPSSPSGDGPTGTYHPDQTETGTILGTVGYMSPEQVRGHEADGRSDIFSLGCVLYEMVSGQRAFTGDSAVETMTAILHDEPPDLCDSGKSVPSELNRIIQHCLEKSPDQRFHSARDLAFALRAIPSDSSARITAPNAARQPVAFWVLAACALLGIAAASAFLVVPALRNTAAITEAGRPGHAFDSLAILPLINVTRDSKADPLCEGLAEDLSGRLSQVGRLKVRPITSTVHYGGQTVDAKTVGRALDVTAVVTGRLRQEGESLVVSLELIDARDNSLVWSNPYKGTRQQILDLQDQIARDLAAKLGLQLTGDEQQRLTKRHTENPSAYMLYTEGKFHFNKFTPEGLQTGIEYFQRALDADPNYGPALAGVARCKVLLGTLYVGPRQTHPEARQLFLKALAIDPNLADAHAGLGAIHLFHDWDWPAAERELRLASENSGWLSWNIYGFWHATQGRLPEALEAIKRGQQLDPAAAARRNELAMCYNWMGRYDEAIDEAQKALELDAKFPLAYTQLGLAHIQQGRPDQAIVKLQTAIDAGQRHPGVVGALGCAYAAAGQRDEARKTLAQVEGLSQGRFGFAMPIARIHAALGNNYQAFEWLNKACEEHDPGVIWLKVDRTLDNLRADPRFDAFLREMRLADKAK